jgi:peptidoglycan/xylan/chitin deacetylase (PgdA/CDA1 family)
MHGNRGSRRRPAPTVSSSRHLVGRAVKVTAATIDRVHPPAPGVVVLLYHRVGRRSSSEVDLDASIFDEQMAFLAASTEVVRLGDALQLLAVSAPPERRRPVVVVTFDDGTDDFVDVAVPILARHSIPVTMYLATSFVDEGVPFFDGGRPASWAGLADARATGLVDIGSHTHRHQLLDRLPAAEIDEELDRSVGLIRDRLGLAATDFAYPKAVFGSPAAAAAVRLRFRSAAVAGTRANVPGRADPYRLARSPIQVGDAMTFFRRKVAGGMGLEDTMRRTANRVRYAGKRS